jgi:integrase
MSHPKPVWDNVASVWRVDLRSPWKLGRRIVNAPPPPGGLATAIHAARDLLDALRSETIVTSPQLSLPGTLGRTVESVAEQYLAEREFRGTSGKWLRETAKVMCREIGREPLRIFQTADGAARLLAWRDEVRGRGVGPRAMKDRLNVFSLIWRWCADAPRQWVSLMPVLPSPKTSEKEVLHHPAMRWIDESTFRAVRAAIYDNVFARTSIAKELRNEGLPCDASDVRAYIARRQLYLSFAFYTGMRRFDLNAISDAYLSPDFDCYWRHGHKTGVEVAAESICEPFRRDIAAERSRLGRSWHQGELICGGPWFHATRVIATAARKLGLENFDLMTCRRSFVYHKALAGVPESKLINLLGHSDSRMIRGVYLLLQPRLQRDEAGAAWPRHLSVVPGTGGGRVLPLGSR